LRFEAPRELLYEELEAVRQLRRQAKREMIVECRKYPETKLLCSVPFLGPVRAAVLIGRVQTPHRFRTKRQFWPTAGWRWRCATAANTAWLTDKWNAGKSRRRFALELEP